MGRCILLVFFVFFGVGLLAQSFEAVASQEAHKGTIGDVIKAPIRLKNNTDKTLYLIVRKIGDQLGSTQKNFYCLDNNCLDLKDDYILRLEPGQQLNSFQIGVEAGLVPGFSSARYMIINRQNPQHVVELDLGFAVEETAEKNLYSSRAVILKDVYPNPASDYATVAYVMLQDQAKAKMKIHNLLGNIVAEYEMSPGENFLRMKTYDLPAGIYFYSLVVNNESVMTRKLVVRK